jgi:hypothetical protein
MARRVYFAFHYQNDIWRVNQVRQSWVTQDRQDAGFYDASLWEKAKKESDLAIKRMINSGLQNTSATCVLIGSETSKRRWVQYEIVKSFDKGNALLGVYIHLLKDKFGKTSSKGADPFDDLALVISDGGKSASVRVWKNQSWKNFEDYPTVSLNWKQEYAGKFFRFSELGIKLYDWSDDDGYTNFDKWIENSVKDKENGKY